MMDLLQACADIVAKSDPERFAAAMAAPVAARRVLFPIYAFNAEVARAPWVTEEPMIAEMRLQWWRDALSEIETGRAVRAHEVTTPLAEALDAPGAVILDRLVQARRWDIYSDAFEDGDHFDEYLQATGGALMFAGARALDTAPERTPDPLVRGFGAATALVRFLQAVPALEARGRVPLVDGRATAIAQLAERYLDQLPTRRVLFARLRPPARAAVLEGWQTKRLLQQIAREPERVAAGRIGLSPFRRKVALLGWA